MKVRRRHDTTPDISPERWAFIRFVPRAAPPFTIDVRRCPLSLPRFSHWRNDGTCKCSAASTADGSVANGRGTNRSRVGSSALRGSDGRSSVAPTSAPTDTDAPGGNPATPAGRGADSPQNEGT